MDCTESLSSYFPCGFIFFRFLHFETDCISKHSEALFQKGLGKPRVEKDPFASLEWIFARIMNLAEYFLKCFEIFEFESHLGGNNDTAVQA